MAYLKELDNIINTSISMLLNNQNILKLLAYYPEENILNYNPLIQPEIQNPNDLLMKHIFPMPKQPDATTDQICLIDVNVAGTNNTSNKSWSRILLTFDVICHLDSWIIKNGYRPLKIISEIDEMFNNKMTNLDIENKPVFYGIEPHMYANKFFGYRLIYELILNSNLECGIK